MRGLFGGVLGTKAGPEDLLKELLDQLDGSGISDSLWEKVLQQPDLEDILEEEPRRESLAACAGKCPANVYGLVGRCVQVIEDALAKQGADFDEAALSNSMAMLSYLLAASPATPGSPTESTEKEEQAKPVTLWQQLWASESGFGQVLGERIADSALRCLFLEGFTIDEANSEDNKSGSANGVSSAMIWQDGVGPEGSDQPDADDNVRSNRTLALQLLVSFLCGGAPSAAPEVDEEPNGKEEATAAKKAAADDLTLSRPLVLDRRPLAYLCDPQRAVPRRAELFYSLLSVALGYDPHGYGVPYGGYFAGAKQEAFTQLSLQVLGLLLQDSEAKTGQGIIDVSGALVTVRPQERLGCKKPIPEEECLSHAFRELLASVTSEREVSFMVTGVVTLLGTVSQERNTYLPSSLRLPPFLPELLVLVLHLSAVPSFVQGACAEGEICSLVEGVLHAACQTPDYLRESTVGLLEAVVLLNLTSYGEVCIALNEEFEGELPDQIPDFEGTVADLVALSALTQASGCIASAKVSRTHQSIVEISLATVANLSTFADGFCAEAASRLFSIFERCSKSAQVKHSRSGMAIFLPVLLEAFHNALQYQYVSNTHLAYGLMTRQALFRELTSNVLQIEVEKGNDPELLRGWLHDLQLHLGALTGLLDATVPKLEAEVEKQDISTSDEAKALLPRSILGFLPTPHPFQLRSLRPCEATHLVCEHILAASVGNSPMAFLWEPDEDNSATSDDRGRADEGSSRKRPPGVRERSSSRAREPKSRERSSSRSRGNGSSRAHASATSRASSASRPKTNGSSPPAAGAASAEARARLSPELARQLEAAAAAGVDIQMFLAQMKAGEACTPPGTPPSTPPETASEDRI